MRRHAGPPCAQPCGTRLPCGHTCASPTCHDPPPPAVAAFLPPAAPKVRLTPEAMTQHLGNGFGALAPASPTPPAARQRGGSNSGAAQQQDAPPPVPPAWAAAAEGGRLLAALGGGAPSACPACVQPVPVTCVGGHEVRPVPCSQARPYSCGAACGAPLACGNHTCPLPCHARGGGGGTACRPCDQPCGRPRACGHACPQPCHPGACAPCGREVRTPCHCGKALLQVRCALLAAAADSGAAGGGQQPSPGGGADPRACGKPCHRPLPNCPHPCRAACHAGACPGATR